ncbi:hypothetical protein BD311DRAFT_757232 [Dichomitus squalens]|uniref:Uncharacterized protein n=1 Tax=Dichomitus squalens TaxID=114155 RepID=A0A4Q9MMW2_9APHY|nr:hypothetical protein BD311DRAFT_757232 [Dichomitus squalens]
MSHTSRNHPSHYLARRTRITRMPAMPMERLSLTTLVMPLAQTRLALLLVLPDLSTLLSLVVAVPLLARCRGRACWSSTVGRRGVGRSEKLKTHTRTSCSSGSHQLLLPLVSHLLLTLTALSLRSSVRCSLRTLCRDFHPLPFTPPHASRLSPPVNIYLSSYSPRVPSWSHLHTICQPYMYVYMDGHQDLSVLALALFCLTSCISSFPVPCSSLPHPSLSPSRCVLSIASVTSSFARGTAFVLFVSSRTPVSVRCVLHVCSSLLSLLLQLCKRGVGGQAGRERRAAWTRVICLVHGHSYHLPSSPRPPPALLIDTPRIIDTHTPVWGDCLCLRTIDDLFLDGRRYAYPRHAPIQQQQLHITDSFSAKV